MGKAIRVLVVDDSAFMRHSISKLLSVDTMIEIVDTARDGLDALVKLNRLNVDVVTMDVEMPKMDGITALGQIMQRHPVPVVMVSSSTRQGADATIKALALGAVDFVCKPSGAISLDMHTLQEELIAKVKRAAQARIGHVSETPVTKSPPPAKTNPAAAKNVHPIQVVAIGSSTGGPRALHEVIPRLPKDFPVPVVIVQHMPPGFTRSLAEHLNQSSNLTVREAQSGDTIAPGLVLIAPGNYHMQVRRGGVIELNQDPTMHGVRPAVDVMFDSLSDTYGPGCLAVVLTGMGSDGALGAMKIKKSGGQVFAEHESTCIVYGMPKSTIDNGAADLAVPLPQVATTIEQVVTGGRALRPA